ncbi:hypothetical protein V8G54_013598 [Vigna mungo]|uniref:Uncharacterized protein n=1 Tax=Vigna mungo TaxID=3915 RepID=A0AAQ3NVZ0_VIGMU
MQHNKNSELKPLQSDLMLMNFFHCVAATFVHSFTDFDFNTRVDFSAPPIYDYYNESAVITEFNIQAFEIDDGSDFSTIVDFNVDFQTSTTYTRLSVVAAAGKCKEESTKRMGRLGGIYTLPSHLSPSAMDLIPGMLVVDPMRRMTIPEIRQHPCSKLVFHVI